MFQKFSGDCCPQGPRNLLQGTNWIKDVQSTWPGGSGWASRGWPAATGSSSPCPAAAPASWRWTLGPGRGEMSNGEKIWGSTTVSSPGQNAALAPISELHKHKYRRWRELRDGKLVSRCWQGNKALIIVNTWIITGVATNTIIVKSTS